MILDLDRFTAAEKPYWDELDQRLQKLESDPGHDMTLEEATRFHYLYQRCSAGLARTSQIAGEVQLRAFLEALLARAYAEIHEVRGARKKWSPLGWLFGEFPATFRAHAGAFALSLGLTIAGTIFGAAALLLDPAAKAALMPFQALNESPAERVAREQRGESSKLAGHKGEFSAQLMTHNTQVAIFTLGLGATFGVGSVAVLFYNGVMLGAVTADYVKAGFAPFLAGWLLPHGSIEIPAILIAGQAAFVLAGALIGDGRRRSRRERLRHVTRPLVTLIGGAGVMLVWAGIIEAFFSQYHEPVIPYAVKIAFGVVELIALTVFLTRAGRTWKPDDTRL